MYSGQIRGCNSAAAHTAGRRKAGHPALSCAPAAAAAASRQFARQALGRVGDDYRQGGGGQAGR